MVIPITKFTIHSPTLAKDMAILDIPVLTISVAPVMTS